MREYKKALNRIVDDIFHEADRLGMSNMDLAVASDLCYSTVIRLDLRVTQYPRLDTVYKLCNAVGFELIARKAKAELRVAYHKLRA